MKHQNLEFKWMCLLFLALLLSPPLLWGQNHSIKGQIVDAKSNEPLIGVNITVEGTSNGTISDIDGRFTLSVAANAVLKISYIGYQEKKIKVDDLKKEPIISLEEDSKQLEEVVVVGYGIQKKVSSVGAITQTKGEELLKGGNITSVSEALQGKAASSWRPMIEHIPLTVDLLNTTMCIVRGIRCLQGCTVLIKLWCT